jgi:pimeloyl-ACP methyl ester carboxylesterase
MSLLRSIVSRLVRKPLLLIAIAATLVVAVAMPVQASTRSTPVAAGHPQAAKPTIVLVHGAWADASSWSRVIKRLQADGYTVDAPPNPLRGLPYDTDYLRDYLLTVPGPIVLVGHSYGGAVITDAATGNPNVKALVYVDAFVPDTGETLQQLIAAQPGSVFAVADPTTVFNLAPYPNAPAGDGDTYIKSSLFHADFAADLSTAKAAEMAATQRPLAGSATQEPSSAPAWKTIPSWYLVGTADKVIPPAEQLAMALRAGSHITSVRASHASLVSRPDAVEQLVVSADRATR